jgi:hypothetical protein
VVCRSRPGGSASTSYAQQVSGLPANAVLSLSHQLRHEGREAPAPERAEVERWASETAERVLSEAALSEARRRSITERLNAAASEEQLPTGADFYSWRNIVDRAAQAARSIDLQLRFLSQRLGMSQDEAQAAFNELYERADGRSSGIDMPTEWAERFRSDPENGYIPGDRGTLYALHELYARAGLARPGRVGPLRRSVNGHNVRRVGYDRASGRLDVELADGQVHTYINVPAVVYQEMLSPGVDVDQIFYTRVQARAGGASAVVAAGSPADRQRCPDCGQFCDETHVCPSPGALDRRLGLPPISMPTQADASAQGAPSAEERRPAPRLVMAPTRRVAGADFAMVVPSRADVGAFASEHPEFDLPIAAEPDDRGGLVTGTVRVARDPATQRLVATWGDLQCTCAAFAEQGECSHTRGALQGVNAHLSGRRGEQSLRHVSMAAMASALEERLSAEQFPLSAAEVSFSTDMAAFQAAYDAARARMNAGQSAVEFHPEGGVTGGAAAPGGRGFGIEIEFACSDYWERDAIARELHEAGLIREPVQNSYHGTQREARAGLWHRWGYERDSSVTGGEIVSPVLYDRPEDWAEIATVCEIVRRHGGSVNRTTGCHVHVGAGDFGTTPEAHNALLAEMRENEDLMYRLAQRPGAGRHRMNSYSSPAYIPPDGYESVSDVRRAQSGHDRPLNFAAVNGNSNDHVELRVWDGTLDPGAIQAQVAISVGMVEAARAGRACPPGQGSGELGAHRRANQGRRRLQGEAWEADTAPFRFFADRVLATPRAKAQAAALYAASRWQHRNR